MHGDENVRRWVLLVAAISIVGLLATAGAVHYLDEGPGESSVGSIGLVEPLPNGSQLWPYTSRSEHFGTATLAVNVIALGPGEHVQQEFRRQVEANWTTRAYQNAPENGTGPQTETPANGTERVLEIVEEEVVWLPAQGATRYTYVRSVDGEGRWLTESYQLYDGSYLGTRHHVRAYESPYGPWTAMQGHREYWDWFRLRHTVTSIADTQQYVDSQFLDDERVERVYKVHLGNGASQDGNGWATVLDFAALTGLLLSIGRGTRLDRLGARLRAWLAGDRVAAVGRIGVLFVVLAGLYLSVRLGGVVLERQFADVSPKVIAGALYPVLALGLPVAAYRFARHVPPEEAFVTAASGFVAGFVLEYGYLGLEVIPVALLLHRVVLVLSLGLVAAGGALSASTAEGWTRLLGLGVAGWVVALGLPLAGLV